MSKPEWVEESAEI